MYEATVMIAGHCAIAGAVGWFGMKALYFARSLIVAVQMAESARRARRGSE